MVPSNQSESRQKRKRVALDDSDDEPSDVDVLPKKEVGQTYFSVIIPCPVSFLMLNHCFLIIAIA